jgi:UDP-N-acetylenolpyruvoylglucosamine reductase
MHPNLVAGFGARRGLPLERASILGRSQLRLAVLPIEGVGAGRLIDKVGLKGHRVGGAQVSEKHANFIVNTGDATARDVRDLIKLIQEKVLNDTGYKLETEISFVGEF